VHSCLNICWGAQAALQHFHGVPKHVLPLKRSGVYAHRNLDPTSPYLRGLSDEIDIPVSRWSEVRPEDLPADGALKVLLDADGSGLCLLEDPVRRSLHMFNHLEYEATTLAEEFARDRAADPATPAPLHYFPGDDPRRPPLNRWRSHAHLLFSNWINQIYQTTPFDLEQIGA
jgi:homoserine O-succinyltransferase